MSIISKATRQADGTVAVTVDGVVKNVPPDPRNRDFRRVDAFEQRGGSVRDPGPAPEPKPRDLAAELDALAARVEALEKGS